LRATLIDKLSLTMGYPPQTISKKTPQIPPADSEAIRYQQRSELIAFSS
jgi:hypothetical protein